MLPLIFIVGGRMAVFVVARVVAGEVDRLLAFEVDEAQHLPRRISSSGARRNDLVGQTCMGEFIIGAERGCSSMAEHQLPKLNTWVRFPSPAPNPLLGGAP